MATRKKASAATSPRPMLRPSFMTATSGGGCLEPVVGFNAVRARSEGFRGGRVPPALRNRRLATAADLEFAHPQFTFGNDDRVPVGDSSALPWRCVCHLVVKGLHSSEVLGTGWFAGPRTVITAGHNLFSPSQGSDAHTVWVMPARSGDAIPYGFETCTDFAVHPRWRSHGDRECDVGVIWLEEPLGDRVGWFGIGAYSDQQLERLIVNNAGYPADKPMGTQWFNAGRVLRVDPRTLSYGLDTEPGQSGSPIFHFTEANERIVVAVHAYGLDDSNFGVRITPLLFDQFVEWIK